ncbi:MAG: hypothetical protein V1822_02850 [Candidatus Micrarchaeota archaeon]
MRNRHMENIIRGCVKNLGFAMAIVLLVMIVAALVVRAFLS